MSVITKAVVLDYLEGKEFLELSSTRAIIVFGKNSATYKFALLKTLMEKKAADYFSYDEIGEPFLRHLVSGLSLSEAYRRSYDAQNMKPATIHKEAHKLMKNPRVTTMYESLAARADGRIISQRIADRTEILETLTSLMRGQLSADANRVRATQLLSQAQGLLREPLESPGEERSPEEIREGAYRPAPLSGHSGDLNERFGKKCLSQSCHNGREKQLLNLKILDGHLPTGISF